jgi:hypothetical protein
MKRTITLIAAALLAASATTRPASAGRFRCSTPDDGASYGAYYGEADTSSRWHGGYYDVAWGRPVALVVPPTAHLQTHYSWGVGGFRVTPIYHQYELGNPTSGDYDRAWFQPTPRWPSSTDQFGDYYIRGPW